MSETAIAKIYSELYDITNQNMQEAGKELAVTKQAFVWKQQVESDIFDVSSCGDCDNDSFLQMAYLGMLGRLPDSGAAKKWHEKISISRIEFRRILIEQISRSEEFAKRNVAVMNNIYNRQFLNDGKRIYFKPHNFRKIELGVYHGLKRIYNRLPDKMRSTIKRQLRR